MDHILCVEDFQNLISFQQLEDSLRTSGPWIAGFDFPFGQPKKLIVNLGWPLSWEGYVKLLGNMTKDEFAQILTRYRKHRDQGDKHHMRFIDKKARSCSPMMLYGVPVAKMFFEGAPILLRSGASIIPNYPLNTDRIIVEAYPALVARKFVGMDSYKNDTKSKQTSRQRDARARIVERLSSDSMRELYGFHVELRDVQIERCVGEPGADLLDSVLCAIQAAWAYENREENYGIPIDCDPLEGWITDPDMQDIDSRTKAIKGACDSLYSDLPPAKRKPSMELKERYESLKSKVVERKADFDAFINMLEVKTSWLTSPASTRFHLNVEEGLLTHSVGVAKNLLKFRDCLAPQISDESCVIVGLLHDVGKVGMPGKPLYLKNDNEWEVR
ncbi:MAG: DUF429 domain-containing protein, partial [Candidatus Thorarchaeota archaeon]